MPETLYLFTAEYPYGKGETFIENEIGILCREFDKVILFPHVVSGEARPVPSNVQVCSRPDPYAEYTTSRYFFRNVWLITTVLFSEWYNTPHKWFFTRNIRTWIVLLCKAIHNADFIETKIERQQDGPDYFYSFWNNDWALALAVLKQKKIIRNFVTRSGGFDIYDERHPGNYMPFRRFVYKYCSRIMPNSRMGENYIKDKHMYPEKVFHDYWGTIDHGINPKSDSDVINLVSVGNMIPLKRTHLIIELLLGLKQPYKWVHFGDGPLEEELRELSLRINDQGNTVDFKGRVKNEDVLEYYKTNPVDLFITTSYTEGLPVSIQEAISFGIPVFATDVGGMREIVNDQTGYLIQRDFEMTQTISQLSDFIEHKVRSAEFRNGVREFWRANFNADEVYRKFCRTIREYPG